MNESDKLFQYRLWRHWDQGKPIFCNYRTFWPYKNYRLLFTHLGWSPGNTETPLQCLSPGEGTHQFNKSERRLRGIYINSWHRGLTDLLTVSHHQILQRVTVSSYQLQHGVAANVPDHKGLQSGGSRENVPKSKSEKLRKLVKYYILYLPQWIHSEQRGASQLQVFQWRPIFLNTLQYPEQYMALYIQFGSNRED